MNKCFFMGNMTRDAELKYTNGGTAICKFSLAVNEKYKQGDEWKEKAHFFNFVLWGRRGEALAKYLTKGTKLVIEAKAEQSSWEDKEGNRKSRVEFRVDNVEFGGGGRKDGGGGSSDYSEYEDGGADDKFEDDVPF